MKAQRDVLVAVARVMVEHVHRCNVSDECSYLLDTEELEEALYEVCEAEHRYEKWMQEVVMAARLVATSDVIEVVADGGLEGNPVLLTLADHLSRLREALEGTEPVEPPPPKGPYR